MSPHPATEQRIRAVLQQPDGDVLAALRRQQWTGHNIPLTTQESTLGGGTPLIGDDPRTVTIKKLIRRLLDPAGTIRILDLGALEGGVSFEMAREGWEVVGVEGRESNFRKAELIRRYFGLDNIRFELRDVKTLSAAADGRFDAILCCGLLYHLDDPFAFLRTLREMTAEHGFVFLDTHVAPESAPGEATYGAQLSSSAEFLDGERRYDGRWFTEPSGGSVLDEQWSAVSNPRSFWPSRHSLIRGICHAGFGSVMDLYGMFEIDGELALRERFSRVWLACMARL